MLRRAVVLIRCCALWAVAMMLMACGGTQVMADRVAVGFVDGGVVIVSCWDDDRLVELGVEAVGDGDWVAVEIDGRGLPLSAPIGFDEIDSSSAYDVSGQPSGELANGDTVRFRTRFESRGFEITDEMLSDAEPPSC